MSVILLDLHRVSIVDEKIGQRTALEQDFERNVLAWLAVHRRSPLGP